MKKQKSLTRKKQELQQMVKNGCPLGDDFINSLCPVRSARKLTSQTLASYVDNLTEKQIDGFFIYHQDCNTFFSC